MTETGNRRPYVAVYMSERDKAKLEKLAAKFPNVSRPEYILSALTLGAVLLNSLEEGDVEAKGMDGTLLIEGTKFAGALMGVGAAGVLSRWMSLLAGKKVDLGAAVDEWNAL